MQMLPAHAPSDVPPIEKMRTEDIADVLAIDAASFQGHRTTADNLQEEMARPWSHLWVARAPGGKIAAFIVLWHVADEVHVLNVATDPSWRRQGFARALMEHTITFAQSHEVRLLMLEVRRSNTAAMALYRALGFSAMGVRRGYYSDGEDGIEMMLTFDPQTKEIVHQPDEITIP
ncbi:ribosomal protein S18-alanine N-acetyltransferase [Pendulispora brunnea]|uniref:Ribosomal protein S18-alanine N-acetyltransferase n=1 Tax=Pendulispora brunnea TaxID=2905690 RepID=A0ABZ2K4A0_9BACT